MKRTFVLLMFILCIAFVTSALTSCLAGFDLPDVNEIVNGGTAGGSENGENSGNEGGENKEPNGDGGENTGNPDQGESGEEEKEPEPEPEPEPVVEKLLNVIYRYDYDGDGTEEGVYYQKILNTEGFTEEKLAEKDNFVHPEGGFGFYEFYADDLLTEPFDFGAMYENDIEIYCKRNFKEAGKNIIWTYNHLSATLTFTGTGDMYDFGTVEAVPWKSLCQATVKTVIIEEGITSVAARAFHSFTNIETVDLPTTINRIGNNAFYKSSIKHINFPKGLKIIGESAFTGCEGLVELYFNKGLEQILSGAFTDCINLKAIVLTDTIMNVGVSAFRGCSSIETAYYFGTEQQYNDVSISLDNFWVDKLAYKYFYSAEAPEKPGPYWKLRVDENEFETEQDIYKWYYTIWYVNMGEKLPFTVDYVDINLGITEENIEFFNNIVHPGGYRFANWKNESNQNFTLTEGDWVFNDLKAFGNRGNLCGENLKYSIRGGVLSIEKINKALDDGAMWDFTTINDSPFIARAISRVDIKEGVTYLGKNAFVNIYNTSIKFNQFTYIDIPEYVTKVHPEAFVGCADLLYIFYAGSDISNCEGLGDLTKKDKAVVYANANSVEDLSTLGAGSYHKLINNKRVAWTYDAETKTLYVGAGGDQNHRILNFGENGGDETRTPWYSYRDEIVKAVVRDNVTTIGSYTFYGLQNLTEIVVPETVTAITATAFQESGYYINQLETLGYVCVYNDPKGGALRYGHLLKVLNPETPGTMFIIPNGTLSIAKDAFQNCTNITQLVITKDVRPGGIYSGVVDQLVNLEVIYFDGTKALFESNYLNMSNSFKTLNEAGKVYYYSELKPSDTENTYWKWSNNLPIVWIEEQ